MTNQVAMTNDAATRRAAAPPDVSPLPEQVSGLYRASKEKALELEHKFEDKIREKPIKSVLLAAGVGAGVGLLLGVVLARR
jgi:ElaB/YqjD/DUF883 family membrane-anchored ribosome-binding protein